MARDQVPLNLEEPGNWDAPEAAARVKSACGKLKTPMCLGVPTERVQLRVIDLPSADEEEVEEMVELQVDKFSPFPIENLIVSHEILSQTDDEEEEESSRVLIAAVQRDFVEELGGLFQEAGLPIQRIDVEIMGWLRHFRDHEELLEQGRQMVLLCDHESTDLVVLENGLPIVFRSLGGQGDELRQTFVEEVAEEIGYTLTSLESEWGPEPTYSLKLFHWDAIPADLAARIQEDCDLNVETRALEDLPILSEGLALRYPDGDESRLDLSPREWHEAAKSRHLRKQLFTASAVLLLLWLVGMSVIVIGHERSITPLVRSCPITITLMPTNHKSRSTAEA
ncbi:MAG: pilus assembly protein PilM, partial [Verrucomicrobiota bacterium]